MDDELPVYIPGEIDGYSCPHCKAGVHVYFSSGDVYQCHNDRWCIDWRKAAHNRGVNPLKVERVYV